MDVIALIAVLAAGAALLAALASTRTLRGAGSGDERIAALTPAGARLTSPAGERVGLELEQHTGRFAGSRMFARDRESLARAGVALSPHVFYALHLGAALLMFLIVVALIGQSTGGIGLGLLAAIAGFFVPRLAVSWRERRRARELERQLIDLLSMVATSVRAGFSLMQSLESVSRRLGPPI